MLAPHFLYVKTGSTKWKLSDEQWKEFDDSHEVYFRVILGAHVEAPEDDAGPLIPDEKQS